MRRRLRGGRVVWGLLLAASVGAACGGSAPDSGTAARPRPSILLVTFDTTRFDAIGPAASGISTPAFDGLVSEGRTFLSAYATVPETLPSHASILSGLYPAGHGIHENGRVLGAGTPLLAEGLKAAGYRTAAFVSAFVLARRYGLARGFDEYDDGVGADDVERRASETTSRALTYLTSVPASEPLFLWVHYFDAHAPYDPPEPFRSRYPEDPYRAEVAAVDAELGKLVAAFRGRSASTGAAPAIVVTADHGEGLGDHGEAQHGYLLYQSTMHVPLVMVGPNVTAGTVSTPVSTRRIFHTVLDWAGTRSDDSLAVAQPRAEVVIGEAMKPFLQYGWQPQIMTVSGTLKAILSGRIETYDLATDGKEARDLGPSAPIPADVRTALDEYPVPSLASAAAPPQMDDDARQKLASLGYVSATATPTVRPNAPRAADMTGLFGVIDAASGLFVRGDYARVVPLLKQILAADPGNLDATMRLATAYSSTGQNALALETFRAAAALAPQSQDVRLYLALHYVKGNEWPKAVPLLEQVIAQSPERLPALEALAVVRERQGNLGEAVSLRQRIHRLRPASAVELLQLGELAMAIQQTSVAIDAFEQARAMQGTAFPRDLELGVLYLAARRYDASRDALDRVLAAEPRHPMALFKRAQVSVLLNEPDQAARIDAARRGADATTRELIANERLFRR